MWIPFFVLSVLLSCVGGLQRQGHQAAFPTPVCSTAQHTTAQSTALNYENIKRIFNASFKTRQIKVERIWDFFFYLQYLGL